MVLLGLGNPIFILGFGYIERWRVVIVVSVSSISYWHGSFDLDFPLVTCEYPT